MKRRMMPGIISMIMYVIIFTGATPTDAQLQDQSFLFQARWNALYLEIAPQPNDMTSVWQDVPVESVSVWYQRRSSVQYIQNPDELLPDRPDWVVYYSPGHPGAFLINLYVMHGGHAYPLTVTGSKSVNFKVNDHPTVRPQEWHRIPSAWTMQELAKMSRRHLQIFSPSLAHNSQEICHLNISDYETR